MKNAFLKCSSKNCEKYSECKRKNGKNGTEQDYSRNLCNEKNNFKWFIKKTKIVTKEENNG